MAAPNTYNMGNNIRCSVSFRNLAGALANPTVVTFRYQDPSGNETILTLPPDAAIVNDGTGQYHSDITIDEEGLWYYRWEGTGALIAAAEFYFQIRDSEFTP